MKYKYIFLLTLLLLLPFIGISKADSKNIKVESDKNEVQKVEYKKIEKKNEVEKTTKAGSKVHIDPKTGEFLTREEALEKGIIDVEDSLIFGPAVVDEIIEEPLPGGGFKVKLPSSYNHTIKANSDSKGEIKTSCDHD